MSRETPSREIVETSEAPAAIGTYSQAVRAGNLLYVSGQIPLDPATGEVSGADIEARIRRVFDNLRAVIEAGGGTLSQVVKLTVFLTDLGDFPVVNQVMAETFEAPYPARAAVGVAALPKGVDVEMDAIVVLS